MVSVLGTILLAVGLVAPMAALASGDVPDPDEPAASCAENQGEPNGSGASAQDPGEGYEKDDSFGAADFTLRSRCKVISVRIDGIATDGAIAKRIRIWIYENDESRDLPPPPGTHKCVAVAPGPGPDFVVPVSDCTLRSGSYWLAVQVQQDYVTESGWYWALTDERHHLDDAWRNPRRGIVGYCRSWRPLEDCVGVSGEYRFSIKGS